MLHNAGPAAVPRRRDCRSVWSTNLVAAIVVGALRRLAGRQAVLLVELPLVVLAGVFGIWLFYVQHQFEGTARTRTPEWRFSDAALHGSSGPGAPAARCSSSPATSGSTTSTT